MTEETDRLLERLTAHLDRGWELATKGDLVGAMASAEQTLEIDGDSPDAHNLIGYIHAANGNAELALEHYRQAIDLDELCLEAMLNAAELLIHPIGDFDQAVALLDQALECCETSDEVADATVLKVDALLHAGRREKAMRVLGSLPEGPFDNPHLDFLVGRAYFELGHKTLALPLLQRAAETQDAHPDAHYYLGLLLATDDDRKNAMTSLLRARQLDERAPRAPWSPGAERFERAVQQALRGLSSEQAQAIDGALIVVSDLPGYEVVADGVDPRAPLLIDDVAPSEGDAAPEGLSIRRLFVYQRNVERMIRNPLALAEELTTILEQELRAQLSTNYSDRPRSSSRPPKST